jgi:hypothetical protein
MWLKARCDVPKSVDARSTKTIEKLVEANGYFSY